MKPACTRIDGMVDLLGQFPDFSFYDLDRIVSVLQVNQFGHAAQVKQRFYTSNVVVVCGFASDDNANRIRLTFENAREIQSPRTAQFSELEVQDVSNSQLEAINWDVRDFGDSDFYCVCERMSIAVDVDDES